jgi:hypothetical protein
MVDLIDGSLCRFVSGSLLALLMSDILPVNYRSGHCKPAQPAPNLGILCPVKETKFSYLLDSNLPGYHVLKLLLI